MIEIAWRSNNDITNTHRFKKLLPKAPSTLARWFPIALWLPKYNWGKFLTADLIPAVSVGALLIPESMGYSSVAGVPVQIGLYAVPLATSPVTSFVSEACF